MMFDSLKLYLKQERASCSDMLAQTPVFLDNLTEHKKAGRIHYSGNLKNLNIYVSERGVSIKGSLAKYYLDDNLQTLTRKDTEHAIDKLSDDLHIPVKKADVSRIDFAHNFIMKYKPIHYYSYLGDSQYFSRYLQPKSLYYKNGNRTKLFYDKRSEAKNKTISIPDVLRDKNVLRYEIRYRRRLGNQLNEPELKASTLYKEPFYIKLIDRYVSDYNSIHKIPEIKLNTDKMDSPKDFWRQIALLKIDEIGVNRMMEIIEEWRAKDVFDNPAYYSRLKKEIRDYSNKYKADDSAQLIEELDNKVSALQRYYR